MYQSVLIRKVSTGSIFKLVFIGLSCSLPATFLLLTLLSSMGMGTVQINGSTSNNYLASPVTGLILALLLSVFVGALMSLGLWIYARFTTMRLDIQLAQQEGEGQIV